MITVNSIKERREAVTAINDYDNRTGGLKSQRAKYEKPLWWYILAILNGRDVMTTQTIQNIVARLKTHGIVVSWQSVNRTVMIMFDTDRQIHPHRRGCGIGCHEAVKILGGLLWVYKKSPVGRTAMSICLNSNQHMVDYYRRSWNIKID
jgi:hypothetical protein